MPHARRPASIRRVKWKAGATTDPAQIARWWHRWPQANVGVATGRRSGIVVVDVDGAAGRALFAQVCTELGFAPSLSASTGRPGGGTHIYYRCAEESPNNAAGGLDLRGGGGLVVAPPSLHASGAVYRWRQAALADMPAPLLAWFWARAKRKAPSAGKAGLVLPAHLQGRPARNTIERATAGILDLPEPSDLAAALAAIPNDDAGWDQWNRIGMATWAACGGAAPQGLAAFEAWSAKSAKHVEGACAERWRAYAGCPPTDLQFGTLVYEARQAVAGWEPPSQRVRLIDPFAESEVMQHQSVCTAASGHPDKTRPLPSDASPAGAVNGAAFPFADAGLAALSQEKSLNPLIQLNERYSVIGDMGGKCLVMGWVRSKFDDSVKVPSFQSFKSFSERYASTYVLVKHRNSKDELVEDAKQLGAHWLKWPQRRSFEGLDLVPGAEAVLPGNVLNLWCGFAVAPAPGRWERMKWHIIHILAQGDAAAALYILRFAAWTVQHPGERAEVALVFKGGKGSGKSTFANALKRLFGAHGLQIFSRQHLVGAFNGHLRNCLLLFADEAFWAGDKQGKSALKGLLTEPILMIEQKGIDAAPWKNRLHVIMAANADWVVPASHDERRYAMFDVSAEKIGDLVYFKELHHEIEHGGLAAMLHDLQQVELGGWHPRQILHTAALRTQKLHSLNPWQAWWEQILQDGVLPFHVAGAVNKARGMAVLGHFRETAGHVTDTSAQGLARFLKGVGGDRRHDKNGTLWTFKPLNELRIDWDRKMGGWNWDYAISDWSDFKP